MNQLPERHKHGNRWHPESCISIYDVAPLWQAGLSTRQIAEVVGCGKSVVQKLCARYGLKRTKSEANIIRQPPTSTHWRSSRAAARTKMRRYLGRFLEPYEHVHHKDGDFTNNSLDNLEVLRDEDHYDLHWPKRKEHAAITS